MFYFTCNHCNQKTTVTPLRWARRHWYRIRYHDRSTYYDTDRCFILSLPNPPD